MPRLGHFLFAVVNPCVDCLLIGGHGPDGRDSEDAENHRL